MVNVAGKQNLSAVQSHVKDNQIHSLKTKEFSLVARKVPIRISEFRINPLKNQSLETETISLSSKGLLFSIPMPFRPGTLLRAAIELPDFWARKSALVGYKHTDAPTSFQMLVRVVSFQEVLRKGKKFEILAETVNIDPVDDQVLSEFLA